MQSEVKNYNLDVYFQLNKTQNSSPRLMQKTNFFLITQVKNQLKLYK